MRLQYNRHKLLQQVDFLHNCPAKHSGCHSAGSSLDMNSIPRFAGSYDRPGSVSKHGADKAEGLLTEANKAT